MTLDEKIDLILKFMSHGTPLLAASLGGDKSRPPPATLGAQMGAQAVGGGAPVVQTVMKKRKVFKKVGTCSPTKPRPADGRSGSAGGALAREQQGVTPPQPQSISALSAALASQPTADARAVSADPTTVRPTRVCGRQPLSRPPNLRPPSHRPPYDPDFPCPPSPRCRIRAAPRIRRMRVAPPRWMAAVLTSMPEVWVESHVVRCGFHAGSAHALMSGLVVERLEPPCVNCDRVIVQSGLCGHGQISVQDHQFIISPTQDSDSWPLLVLLHL